MLFASYFAGVRRFFPVGGAACARDAPAALGLGQEDGVVLELNEGVAAVLLRAQQLSRVRDLRLLQLAFAGAGVTGPRRLLPRLGLQQRAGRRHVGAGHVPVERFGCFRGLRSISGGAPRKYAPREREQGEETKPQTPDAPRRLHVPGFLAGRSWTALRQCAVPDR